MATLRPRLRAAPGVVCAAAPRRAARTGLGCAPQHAFRARAAAVQGLDALPPAGSADITLFSPSKARRLGCSALP
jgi:hypothetical protein